MTTPLLPCAVADVGRALFDGVDELAVGSLASLGGKILDADARWRHRLVIDDAQPDRWGPDNIEGCTALVEFSVWLTERAGRQRVLGRRHDITTPSTAMAQPVGEILWTTDTEGLLLALSPNIERVVGYRVEELLRRSPETTLGGQTEPPQLIHLDDADAAGAAFLALMDAGQPFDLEYRCRHKSGAWIWLRHRASVRCAGDGVCSVASALDDVTQRRALEQRLQQSQKMEALGNCQAPSPMTSTTCSRLFSAMRTSCWKSLWRGTPAAPTSMPSGRPWSAPPA
ncbi:MAG: PAS domain-containing protein [Deltaproteobacteria bacterium]|nr:PAS domain-containing protein [Deltaproteobacteria bacterium]